MTENILDRVRLALILLMLFAAGCGGDEPEPEYFTTGNWFNSGTSVIRRGDGWRFDQSVGSFPTYAEARAECDRLNGAEVPPPFSITFTDSTVTTYEFTPEDYHHLKINIADIHARKEAEHE